MISEFDKNVRMILIHYYIKERYIKKNTPKIKLII